MRLFLAALHFCRRRPPHSYVSSIIKPATMLRSRPADATQIQRVAVPTPHNGIPLKRFFTAIAIVLKLHTKVCRLRARLAINHPTFSAAALPQLNANLAPSTVAIAPPTTDSGHLISPLPWTRV